MIRALSTYLTHPSRQDEPFQLHSGRVQNPVLPLKDWSLFSTRKNVTLRNNIEIGADLFKRTMEHNVCLLVVFF